MDVYRSVLEAWQRALARAGGDPGFTFNCPQTFWDVRRQALLSGDHGLLASLQETQGMADLLLIRAHGQLPPVTILDSLGALVKAAHWYRAAGDTQRAAAVGRRSWLELKQLLDQEAAGTWKLPDPNLHWYLLEMAGDAAACFDAIAAARCYNEAEPGFRDMDPGEQAANDYEIFPGMEYISELAHPCLHPCSPPPNFREDGVARIQHKRKHWLGLD